MIKFPCKKCVLYAMCVSKETIRCTKLYGYIDNISLPLLIKKYSIEKYLPNVIKVADDQVIKQPIGPNYRQAFTVNQPAQRQIDRKNFTFTRWILWNLK